MTLQEQLDFFDNYVSKASDILCSKGDDYANEDRLSNFIRAADLIGSSPERVALTMIGIKVIRLGNLIDAKEPNNESIDDSIMDLFNYTALLAMIRREMSEEAEPTSNYVCSCTASH